MNAALSAFLAFLGLFSLINVVGELVSPGFGANRWWIDLWFIKGKAALAILTLSSIVLLLTAFGPPGPQNWRLARASWLLALASISLINGFHAWWLWARGHIQLGFPVPLSLVIGLGLLAAALASYRQPLLPDSLSGRIVLAGAMGACLLVFPLAQMFCFGKTDYRRSAEAVVVFGARAYADGTPSDALADRIRTGCRLYLDGLVQKVVFSGGPGDGAIHETEAMRRMAVGMGVRNDDIILDPNGLNTQATVRNTTPILRGLPDGRILAVSHFYHLPRIKMAYQREGCEVYTVPAEESYILTQMPYYMLREAVAFWGYFFRLRS